jgi:ectoine hydroxylase-related dioxygenase (phytanoyl-CoA dioxygenase family)
MMIPHTITYRIHNSDLVDPLRQVALDVTPAQIEQLVTDGYLVRERLISGPLLAELRAAVDELAAQQGGEHGAAANQSRRFGGLFVRNLVDKHPTFLKLLNFAPTLSLARAVLGPQVQLHAAVFRVTYPGEQQQETHWHFHQRVIPEPLPPWFARPRVIDNLIYLDDLDNASGPLAVVPGSHQRQHDDLPGDDYGDKPGQVVLRVPAGTCITADAGLWHRGLPNTPQGKVRRLIIIGYSPTWMKQIDKPGAGLTHSLLAHADRETRELLGLTGWY